MENKSLVTIADYTKEKILYMIEMAKQFEERPNRRLLEGKVVATLFFEPSTRLKRQFLQQPEVRSKRDRHSCPFLL